VEASEENVFNISQGNESRPGSFPSLQPDPDENPKINTPFYTPIT